MLIIFSQKKPNLLIQKRIKGRNTQKKICRTSIRRKSVSEKKN